MHQVLSQARLVGAVGLDEALVDAPGGLDRSVALISEEVLQALGLGIGEQTSPGQQDAPGPVEPVTRRVSDCLCEGCDLSLEEMRL